MKSLLCPPRHGGYKTLVDSLRQGVQSGAHSCRKQSLILASYMGKQPLSSEQRHELIRAADEATKNAYAPYSDFRVGAAILTAKGEMFSGCNVENASYGMTNCAERTAIFAAVANSGPGLEVIAVAVANARGVPCAPCGACRQVIYEFGPDATIFFQGANGPKEAQITELLPEGFRLK
jgi:cytidine deaminase